MSNSDNSSIQYSVQSLIDSWLKAEQQGEKFPVPFEDAWRIAGYSRKDSAKRKLEAFFDEGFDFHRIVEVRNRNQGGTVDVEVFTLSCDAFKEFCMVSKTDTGKATRRYFIEVEKKWRLVEQHHPDIAEDIEVIRTKEQLLILDKQIELAKLENQKAQADLAVTNLRYTITQTCPEHIQQKVLRYSEIKTIEYRDRVIKEDEIINDGSTVNKTYLCRKFGFLKNGKPDYKRLRAYLEDMPSDAFQLSAKIQEHSELKREYLPMLADLIESERQRYLGE